jgi:hypothetical protein
MPNIYSIKRCRSRQATEVQIDFSMSKQLVTAAKIFSDDWPAKQVWYILQSCLQANSSGFPEGSTDGTGLTKFDGMQKHL